MLLLYYDAIIYLLSSPPAPCLAAHYTSLEYKNEKNFNLNDLLAWCASIHSIMIHALCSIFNKFFFNLPKLLHGAASGVRQKHYCFFSLPSNYNVSYNTLT